LSTVTEDATGNPGSEVRSSKTPRRSTAALRRLHEWALRLPRPVLWASIPPVIGLWGAFDYLLGNEIHFFFFYIFPITFYAFYLGPRAGLLVSILSSAAFLLTDLALGVPASMTLVEGWNAGIRFATYLYITILLGFLRKDLDRQAILAQTDVLTGLMNRRAFQEAAEIARVSAERHGKPLTMGFADLDRFKAINDAQGHEAGDRLLTLVAESLRAAVRESDLVARLGGDEFVFLLPGADQAAAHETSRRMLDRVRARSEEAGLAVTLSIGLVSSSDATTPVSELLRKADEVMYQAKTAGRNGIAQATL